MVQRARLVETKYGLVPESDGWFVVGLLDAAWATNEAFGTNCLFDLDDTFPDLGMKVVVLRPGQPNGMYHRENNQEDFLVLQGEPLLLVEGEERPLKAWDYVHCPPGTEHIFVGAGDGPCVILMMGTRTGAEIVYPRSELALRHDAGVETETPSADEAYAPWPRWAPGRPETDGMPWS